MPWGAPGRGIEMFSFFHLFRFSGFFHFWFSWCTQVRGIEMFSVGSYKIGCILLAGLFFYDIFWVFGPCCLRCPPARLRRLTRLAADTTEARARTRGPPVFRGHSLCLCPFHSIRLRLHRFGSSA